MPKIVKDIELENFDLVIRDGDFVVSASDEQHIELLLLTHPGHWKRSPLTGIGIEKNIKGLDDSENIQRVKQKIKLQMETDGFANVRVRMDSIENIEIDGIRN